MKKLHIGMVIDQLNGKPQKFSEDGAERDMTVGDVIVQLIPSLGGQKSDKALILWGVGLKIRSCKNEWIELENHDYNTLKSALDESNGLVWVQTALAKAFEESESLYRKDEEESKKK